MRFRSRSRNPLEACAANSSTKLLVCISFSAANLVMEVGHRKHNAKLFPQLSQNVEKRHGICAAGTRDSNALSRAEQLLFADIFEDFFQH